MALSFDPDDVDPEDRPPLWAALQGRNLKKAWQLLRAGGSLDDVIEPDGSTFLHAAVQDQDREMIEFFLDHGCPLPLESFDEVAHTPLMWAAEEGQLENAEMLLAAGANPNAHDEARAGNTALREAVQGGHRKMVQLLLSHSGDPAIPGWMGISAVDQADIEIAGGLNSRRAERIRKLLKDYPRPLRDPATGNG